MHNVDAHIDAQRTVTSAKMSYGKRKAIVMLVYTACCIVIVNPTTVPITVPCGVRGPCGWAGGRACARAHVRARVCMYAHARARGYHEGGSHDDRECLVETGAHEPDQSADLFLTTVRRMPTANAVGWTESEGSIGSVWMIGTGPWRSPSACAEILKKKRARTWKPRWQAAHRSPWPSHTSIHMPVHMPMRVTTHTRKRLCICQHTCLNSCLCALV